MGKRPTIQMVADLAGVSRGTVDRVLNNRSYVKEEVRVRVLEAVAELGYLSPHAFHSQEMSGGRALKLGVLLPNWTDFFRPEVLRGIEGAREELSPLGLEIVMEECLTDNPEESIQRLDAMVAQGVQGISLCAVNDFSIEAKVTCRTARGCLSSDRTTKRAAALRRSSSASASPGPGGFWPRAGTWSSTDTASGWRALARGCRSFSSRTARSRWWRPTMTITSPAGG